MSLKENPTLSVILGEEASEIRVRPCPVRISLECFAA